MDLSKSIVFQILQWLWDGATGTYAWLWWLVVLTGVGLLWRFFR